jgi:DNA-binding transcriptional LysR family regulator
LGITIIPEVSIRRELHAGLLRRINLDGFDLSFDYYLFYKKGKIFSNAVGLFENIGRNETTAPFRQFN